MAEHTAYVERSMDGSAWVPYVVYNASGKTIWRGPVKYAMTREQTLAFAQLKADELNGLYTMKTNPAKRKTKPRTPAQRAATARMLAANAARKGVGRNPVAKPSDKTPFSKVITWVKKNYPPERARSIVAFMGNGMYLDSAIAATATKKNPARTRKQKTARKRANTVPGYYPNPKRKSAFEAKHEKTMYSVHWASQPAHIYLGVFSKLDHAKEVAQDLADRYKRPIKISTISNLAL